MGNGGAYDPAFLQSAYNLTGASSGAGAGQVVAIVDAYDAPNAETDLNVYRAHYGLSRCTTANGCFLKLNQTGVAGSYPAVDPSWSQEISLDVDMVSAICPNCKIVLIEANTSSFADLGAAVNVVAGLGVTAINNSYGANEWSGVVGYWEAFYNHPGIAVVASTGDNGYGVQFPASSAYTIAVGGTTLNQSGNAGVRNATETAWSGAGSGCSAYVPKPVWQRDIGCAQRTVADVAAVADPGTGVWVYDSTPSGGQSGWIVLGGTSVAAPIVSSVYALAAKVPSQYGSSLYATGASLFDIVSGSNGSCGGVYLCTSLPGYDGPTGNGVPNGIRAFAAVGAATPTGTPTSTATPTPTSSGTTTTTLGLSTVGSVKDEGDGDSMSASRVTVGPQPLRVTSLSAYVGAVDAAPHNRFAVAIYTDSGGAPGSLVAQSGSTTLQPNRWNTAPVDATLQQHSAYWLVYNTNSSTVSLNNLSYNTDPATVGAFNQQVFGAWPTAFGPATLGGWRYSLYATASGASSATATPTGTATSTPSPTRTAIPTTVTGTPTSTPTNVATGTSLGLTTIGGSLDTGDRNAMNGSRIVTSNQSMTVTSISAYVGSIDPSPNNQFSFAIYSDTNGAPGTLVSHSAVGALKATSWNTLSIGAKLTASTAYWLFYNTNATGSSANNLRYNNNSSLIGAYALRKFGTWPSTYGPASLVPMEYSIYASGTLP